MEKEEPKTGLFIGRFQPFHNGHLKAVERILEACEKLVIIIGSAQDENTSKNPFSAKQRTEMIEAALEDAKIPGNRYFIVPIKDCQSHGEWMESIERACPDFEVVFTGNAFVKALFLSKGYKVQDIEIFDGISSTKIRQNIKENIEWKHLVPEKIAQFIEDR
ncbi:MAG: nicotinamide-nucleotide adenylyltransferase [Candidatus Diapherotrites archaeon]|nr:nicotinamide-nucleotide adenylyltransferase [Candidatus Diapherotrites archaeon]